MLVAIAARTWLVVHTHGVIDGDEAIVGIQAGHILRGELPIYYYGQAYMGSLQAYLVALIFAVAGSSVWTLRAEPILLSLVLVYLTWRMAAALADYARLGAGARKLFMTIAALFAALPPLYDVVIELRTWGGWIESFLIMLLLLILIHRLTTRWHEEASNGELALRWAGVGFTVGFGMWIYPMVSVAILAAALWIIIDRLIEIVKRVKASEPLIVATMQSLKPLLLVITAIPTCVIGFTPGIIWGAAHQWENIRYIFGLGGG